MSVLPHPPAFVISLERSQERRGRFFSAATNFGWEVTRFPAVDGRDLRIERQSEYNDRVSSISDPEIAFRGRKSEGHPSLSPNQYACAISHILLWRHVVESGLPALCVFEDDAVIERSFDLKSLPPDADFVFLNDRVTGLIPEELEDDESVGRWLSANDFSLLIPGFGMEAYIVTAEGARKALELAQELFLPIDLQLMACSVGSDLVGHYLTKTVREGLPKLVLYASSQVYTSHVDNGVSYLKGENAFPKVQFGSGGTRIPCWENCDLPRYDIRHPLDLASESADYLFAEHVIEHVTPQEAWNFMVECRRILKPGGILRLCFTDIRRILEAKSNAFDTLCAENGWADGSREGSIGATLFCHGHLGAWTADSLGALLQAAGYDVSEHRPGESLDGELRGIEQHWKAVGHEVNNLETTVLEAKKLVGFFAFSRNNIMAC